MSKSLKKHLINYLIALIPNKKIRHFLREKFGCKKRHMDYITFMEQIRTHPGDNLSKAYKEVYNLDNTSLENEIKKQDTFNLSKAMAAKKIVVFFEIEPYPMCGGQMSLFSYCKFSQQILGNDVPVIMSTLPGGPIHSKNNWFRNDINILRWEQVLKIIKNKEDVIFHIPEADIVNPETGEMLFENRLSKDQNSINILKSVKKLSFNVVVQEITKTPAIVFWNILYYFTGNVTMTTAHSNYSTQAVCTKYGVPLKKWSVFIDLEPYEEFSTNKIEKIILLSPDVENPFRFRISDKLRKELPDWQIIDFYRMSFTDCMELTSRSFATITFGEGIDGYYIHPVGVHRLGLTAYNSKFFPSESWKSLRSVYASYEDMYNRVVDDIKFLWEHPDEYKKAVDEISCKAKQEYKFEEYLENLKNFYKGIFDFYPKRTVYIVGGNGFARECYCHLMKMAEKDASIVFGGFLGHGGYGHTVDYKELQPFYKGEVSDHVFTSNEYVVIGAGYPELRSKIYRDLKKQGVRFFTLVVGNDNINEFIAMGEANIFNHSFPSPNVKIGNGNVFNHDVIIAHDTDIGDFNFFGPRSQILGAVNVGNFNTVGANTILLPHCKIGNNNMIAPLSAVYKGCRNNCYMQGNPALKVGDLS